MPSDPTIIANRHRFCELDIFPPALHVRLMRRSEDAHVWPEHYTISNRHDGAVKYAEVKVRVEALADGDVAAVVDGEWGLNVDFVVCDVADDGAQHLGACDGELGGGAAVLGEMVGVVHGPFAGGESDGFELGDERVIPKKWAC